MDLAASAGRDNAFPDTDRQFAHDALTKAEKACGHVRAETARDMVREVDKDWEQSYEIQLWDLATTQALLDIARQLRDKGGCSEAH